MEKMLLPRISPSPTHVTDTQKSSQVTSNRKYQSLIETVNFLCKQPSFLLALQSLLAVLYPLICKEINLQRGRERGNHCLLRNFRTNQSCSTSCITRLRNKWKLRHVWLSKTYSLVKSCILFFKKFQLLGLAWIPISGEAAPHANLDEYHPLNE